MVAPSASVRTGRRADDGWEQQNVDRAQLRRSLGARLLRFAAMFAAAGLDASYRRACSGRRILRAVPPS